jgi:serine/threonine protein kinase/tetratricopeptide (TPR) repeat protein
MGIARGAGDHRITGTVIPGDRIGHYTVVSHLGSGAMGAVYRATDTTLGRDVALKVLPREVSSDPERLDRFQREARAIAALNHPNIVTIYSVEHDAGVHFLTMELVTGQALDRLVAGGPLPIAQVRELAQTMADALSAAHGKGIVHRDLKPANIMLTDTGRLKVLDFGLAKVQPAAEPGRDGSLATSLATEAGAVLGTPAYMSPEQISGSAVDHRTDIFSLGVLLYELATGIRPFSGRSPAEVTSSILRDAPRPASDLRPAVPGTLSTVIQRCLEKDRTARFSTMSEVSAALRSQTAPAAPPDGPSVAVLPFQNLSADKDNEFFGDGLAEEIINVLSQIDGLRVAARTSSFSFKGRNAELTEIGSKLHVSTVLDGSVRRSGHRVRVTVQLVDVAKGFPLWSERYDREMADIFDVQDEIARAIADKLRVTLAADRGERLVKQATRNVEAYELYLRGRALLLRRGRYVTEGIECLKRAVDLDPEFAAAWSGLADAFSVRGYWGMAPVGETLPKALTAARRAVRLDPELAEGWCALALALLLWEHDYEASAAAFRRCLELNPTYIQGRSWYGLFQLQWVEGRMSEGLAEAQRALQSDPLSAYATTIVAFALCGTGQTAEALQYARRGIELDPDSLLTRWVFGLAAHAHGPLDDAIAAYKEAERVAMRHAYPAGWLVVAYADAGRLVEARHERARLLELSGRTYVPITLLSLAAAAVGEQDLALDLASQACDERDPVLMLVQSNAFPGYERVTRDPRFADIRRRLKLRP